MTLNDYQRAANGTAIFPKDMAVPYTLLGLSGEVGEVCNKYKKIIRDKRGNLNAEDVGELQQELGDVLWYLATCMSSLGLDMEQTAAINLNKLALRQKRGTLGGSGDKR
jgi:NTP pyrophosphatase (non-canonical NTP hydrolase)